MIRINDEGFQAGLESGELQFAGYHRYNRALCLFYMGKNLNALLPELEELLQFQPENTESARYGPYNGGAIGSLKSNWANQRKAEFPKR